MTFSGIITALVTPFHQGKLDKNSFLKLLKSQVEQGVSHFVLDSTTGESPTLEERDLETLVSWFREFEKEKSLALRLMAGTGTFSTKKTVEKTHRAEKLGVDSVLVVTPYYNRPSQEGLFLHFKQIADSTSLPIILYNVPSRTACSLDVPTLARLSKIENIKGLKEASGDMNFFKQIRQACGENFSLLSGDDFTCVESFLSGGDGTISAASNVMGRTLKAFFERAKKNDTSVLEDFKKYEDFLKALYGETNPLGAKQVLSYFGVISSPETRLPLFNTEISPRLKPEVEKVQDFLL
ncbi:MAG: 4-hydroxy-tetrahydrodipicolinate synthase [Bdellovibrionales bacterium]|nr:4-hydroxy-tetrahydrodipicolinate synthase [Bdellovibrionales bacterium]